MSSTDEKPAALIFGDEELSDVTFVVDNQDFKSNKTFLACRSDVFKAMFFGNFKESKEDRVEIKDVSVENFRRFLEIIYTGKISDTSKFLEFPFPVNSYIFYYDLSQIDRHYEVHINPEEAEMRIDNIYIRSPSYEKVFHDFWRDTTEILNIADRFNLSSIVKDYFGSVITPTLRFCAKERGCHQCFNTLIFALINGIDVSKCKRKHHPSYYERWIHYATVHPFPEAIPVKVMSTILKQFIVITKNG